MNNYKKYIKYWEVITLDGIYYVKGMNIVVVLNRAGLKKESIINNRRISKKEYLAQIEKTKGAIVIN